MVKVEVKEQESWKRTLEIELPEEETRRQLEEVIGALRKKVKVPGFRKGKVPRDVVERRFKDSIKDELYQKALPWAFKQALEQADIKPITPPRYEDVQYDDGGPLRFKATVEVMPPLELGALDGFEVVGDVYEVAEEEVNAELEKIREAQAQFLTADREATKGDYLVIDYQRVDPETGAPQGAKSTDFSLELGASSLLPEFAEALTGTRAGESKRVDVDYPEDFANKDLAGKKVSYQVEIKEIREKRLPDLDDKFARRVSEYATLEQLKSRIADNLRSEEAVASRRRLEEKLIDQILAKHPFDPPGSLVDSLGEQFVDSMTQGAELSEKERKDLVERYRPQVARKVRRDLLLDVIAERENVEATDREVGLEIRRMKERGELRPAVEEKELSGRVRERLRARKTIDMLMDKADVKLTSRPKEQSQGGRE
jgi:trigger factor